MARRVRYCVAMSLDGYIAGPNGEADWIVMDPEMDFGDLWAQFDTLLMGRRTFEAAVARLGASTMQTMKVVVASRTLRPEDHPEITIVSELTKSEMEKLRQQSHKDIWMMGGGELFRVLLEMKEVDSVEMSTVPVLLGVGVPLLPRVDQRTALKLTKHKVYRSGVVSLDYEIQVKG
jgi:dihydrofolate reductase